MRFVIDASIAASWCFDDEDDPVANKAFQLLEARAEAIAPALFWFEIRNVALVGLRRNRISPDHLVDVLARIDRAAIELVPMPGSSAVFDLARRHNLTFYDAAYLELALRDNIALATLDQALARAAASEGVALIAA
jgi:predicted nucleic acid-binding protein